MTEEEYILKLFTVDKLKQKEIAVIINKSTQHVLKFEPKAIEEKKRRNLDLVRQEKGKKHLEH